MSTYFNMTEANMYQVAEANNCRKTKDFDSCSKFCGTSASTLQAITRIFRTMKYNLVTPTDYTQHKKKVKAACEYYGTSFNDVVQLEGAVTVARAMEINEDLNRGLSAKACTEKHKFKSPSYVPTVKQIIDKVSNSIPLKEYLFTPYKNVIVAAELLSGNGAIKEIDNHGVSQPSSKLPLNFPFDVNNDEEKPFEEMVLHDLGLIYQTLYDLTSMIASLIPNS